jgi:hypothetical protein
MIQQIYTIYDDKTGAYMTPFYLPTDEAAIRSFEISRDDPNHLFHHNPHDFTLHTLGSFDDQTGEIVTHPPKHIPIAKKKSSNQKKSSQKSMKTNIATLGK